MKTHLYIEEIHLQMIKDIIRSIYPKATVLAYGSRVNGNDVIAHEGSDLDLAVVDFGIEKGYIYKLKEQFSQSNIPFLVDIFDYKSLPQSFQDEIDRKNFVVYDGKYII